MVPPCRGRRPRRPVTKRYHDTPSGECFVTFIPVGATIGRPYGESKRKCLKKACSGSKKCPRCVRFGNFGFIKVCFAPYLPRVCTSARRSTGRMAREARRRDCAEWIHSKGENFFSSTREVFSHDKYAFARGRPMIAPYGQNEGVISSRRRATIPLRNGSSRAPTPTVGCTLQPATKSAFGG